MIIDYLPYYMQEYREMRELCFAEEPEINEIKIYKDNIRKEFFIESATGLGLKKLENMLGIISSDEESIDFRKFRIRSRLAGTKKSLINSLEELMPKGEYTIVFDNENLKLTVRITLTSEKYLNSVRNMLENTVPLNIALSCSVLYTSHRQAGKYTHSQLADYRHRYIKEELYEH